MTHILTLFLMSFSLHLFRYFVLLYFTYYSQRHIFTRLLAFNSHICNILIWIWSNYVSICPLALFFPILRMFSFPYTHTHKHKYFILISWIRKTCLQILCELETFGRTSKCVSMCQKDYIMMIILSWWLFAFQKDHFNEAQTFFASDTTVYTNNLFTFYVCDMMFCG